MAREKMAALLTESICVTPEEAVAALEASDWKVLDAAKLLQRERRAQARKPLQGQRDGGWLRGLFGLFMVATD